MKNTVTYVKIAAAAAAASSVMFASIEAQATRGDWELEDPITLTEDHYGTLRLWDHAELDCAGHTVYMSEESGRCGRGGSLGVCGIEIAGYYTRVANCNVRYFEIGVVAFAATPEMTVENCSMEDNDTGMWSFGDRGTLTIRSNSFSYNTSVGLVLQNDRGARVESNSFYFNGVMGLQVYQGADHLISSNDFWSNAMFGLYVGEAPRTSIYFNIMESSAFGALLAHSSQFDFWSNTVIHNQSYGLWLVDSDNGIVEATYGAGNGVYDAYQDPMSTGNSWYGNSWGATSPGGLP